MKLIDALADFEINELEYDAIHGNITRWVHDSVAEKIVDKAIDHYENWMRDNPDKKIEIRSDEVRKLVLDKLADRIIDKLIEEELGHVH